MNENPTSGDLRFVPGPKGTTGAELAKALRELPRLSPEEAEYFAADVDAVRKWHEEQPRRDPWES